MWMYSLFFLGKRRILYKGMAKSFDSLVIIMEYPLYVLCVLFYNSLEMYRKEQETTVRINRTWIKWISQVLFILYIILLSYFLFFSERYGRSAGQEYRYNIKLFKEMKRFINYRHEIGLESFIVNIFGNVIAFMPFGFVLPIISPENRKLFYITFLSMEFSLSIELIQLIFKVGIFDVDDIFMNTLGGVLGGILFFCCYFICKKHIDRK